MFCDVEEFNQPLGQWDVANVTTLEEMFLIIELLH
jgi:hypothetical protein